MNAQSLPHRSPESAGGSEHAAKRRIRICFLVRRLGLGGAERQLVELVRALDQRECEISVLTFYRGGELWDELSHVRGVKLLSLEKRGRWDIISFFRRLTRRVRELRPDVLHGYLPVPNLAALAAGKTSGASPRIVWGIRTSNSAQESGDWLARLTYRAELASSRFADLVIANSDAGAEPFEGKAKRVAIVANGIDTERWNPATDPFVEATYSADDLAGKAECKAALQRDFGLPIRARVPLIGMVTRLAEQKGLDIVAAALPALLAEDLQIVVLGRGDERYERWLADAGRRDPTRLAVRLAFDESLAHRVEAGADAFLMPSRYEPCGLNQLYSLRYGTVPIVRATGGLDDTIDDVDAVPEGGVGFKFVEYAPEALVAAVRRALARYADSDAWQRIMREGMRRDHSWRRAAGAYLDLYREMTSGR